MGESDLHVVLGTGPAGTATARALVRRGLRVRAVNRSGRPSEGMPASVKVVGADVSSAADAARAAEGAAVVYQALNPPYTRWPELFPGLQASAISAARAAGARYVSLENLYMYGAVGDRPITEDLPMAPTSRKGRVRAEMAEELAALHAAGDLEVATGRAADYYGPTVVNSALGARTFEPLVAGKPAEVIASATTPHSYAFIDDVGEALATLGTRDEAFGEVWHVPHAPALTQGEMVAIAARVAGVDSKPKVLGPTMLRIGGLFIPEARESVEMLYEFTEPFVVDCSKFTSAFGAAATPVETGLAATTAWYSARAKEASA